MKLFLLFLACFVFLGIQPTYNDVVGVVHKSTPLEKRQAKMYKIYDKLANWIEKNTKLNIYVVAPKFEFQSTKKLNENKKFLDVEGGYNIESRTIILNKDFDLENSVDLSILLHEMVHHYQFMNKMKYNCVDEMEKFAYTIEKKWAEENGIDFHKQIIGKLYYKTLDCHFSMGK